jgi:phage FluMu protein Com
LQYGPGSRRGVMRTIRCRHCGCEASFSASRPRAYCSRRCYFIARSMKRTVRCATCGKSFRRGEVSNRYCSHECYTKANHGVRHVHFRGHVTTNNGYVRYSKSHPTFPEWYVHDAVWWTAYPTARCADCSGEVEHVHHLDHDKKNNALENLVGLCARCHIRRHRSAA